MNTFVKTFFICLILCLGFLFYQLMGENSYSPELKLSESSMFNSSKESNHVNNKYIPKEIEKNTDDELDKNSNSQTEDTDKQTEEYNKNQDENKQKYSHSCYFFSKNGELIEIKKEMPKPPTLEGVITLLLKGPTIQESKTGIYSEIPPNVDLISAKNTKDSIIINLSANFGNGGGSKSVENRVRQLSKTVKKYHPKKQVYLYINGKEVEYLGGEGIYIKQPLD